VEKDDRHNGQRTQSIYLSPVLHAVLSNRVKAPGDTAQVRTGRRPRHAGRRRPWIMGDAVAANDGAHRRISRTTESLLDRRFRRNGEAPPGKAFFPDVLRSLLHLRGANPAYGWRCIR
jgi:hypothetical protein